MLCNAAGLTGRDLGMTYIIEQRRLAMIDVAHDGYHRCSWNFFACRLLVGK